MQYLHKKLTAFEKYIKTMNVIANKVVTVRL